VFSVCGGARPYNRLRSLRAHPSALATSTDPVAPPRSTDRAEVSARPGAIRRIRDLWSYRELLGTLVRKELKVKYKNSALGFVWSLLNPLLYLVVFYLVFTYFIPAAIPYFPIFLLSGLLPYNLFSASLGGGTTSIVGNGSLVTKVWFPREILPLASIGAALVHFALQLGVLAAALVVFRYQPSWSYVPLIVPALLTLLVLVASLAIFLAAVNVYARDVQHLLELVLLAWFWMTPIVYVYAQVREKIGDWALLNPLTSIVITMQRAIWGNHVVRIAGGKNGLLRPAVPDASQWWYLRNLGVVMIVSVVMLVIAFRIFGRLEDNFAENI
jgi:ABC-2 type transport system permease protein